MLKWDRTKQAATATIVVSLSWFCYCASGDSLSLRNYDNDPNLAKAIEYDLEHNGADYEKADRAKAEQYYLTYLEDVNESFQKARVYASLGALYATAVNPQRKEKPDYDKARVYFKKVLELEPKRIAYPTIRARTMLASMDQSGSARVSARIDVYEWLNSIDEEKMRKLWLPLTPGGEGPSDLIIRSTKNLQEGLQTSLETNIIGEIKHLRDAEAEEFLLEIAERFAGSELDRLAREKLAEKGIPIPDSATKPVEPEVEKRAEEKDPKEAANPAWASWLLAAVIGAGVLTVVLLLKKKASR